MTGVEVVSALTRQPRSGARDPTAAAMALVQFRHDWAHQYQTVDIAPALLARAMGQNCMHDDGMMLRSV
jgi:hypothetical protein